MLNRPIFLGLCAGMLPVFILVGQLVARRIPLGHLIQLWPFIPIALVSGGLLFVVARDNAEIDNLKKKNGDRGRR